MALCGFRFCKRRNWFASEKEIKKTNQYNFQNFKINMYHTNFRFPKYGSFWFGIRKNRGKNIGNTAVAHVRNCAHPKFYTNYQVVKQFSNLIP